MPEDWLADEPSMIPDPDAEKPEEWDDEEDGDWVPDMVPNPVCQEVSGCGPWEQPTIANPAYKVSTRLVVTSGVSCQLLNKFSFHFTGQMGPTNDP